MPSMDQTYPDVSSLWDLSQTSNFAHVPDDDFMAMLQKQFPLAATPIDPTQNIHPFAAGGFPDGINPQNVSRFSLPSMSPPSEDSSPSPPHHSGSNHEPNYEDAGGGGGNNNGGAKGAESALKRKASGIDIPEDGPSQKSQHTLSNDKKGATSSSAGSRRKSTGGIVQKDETRLMKRKEQNRAAQRAFRERKEKHVKDLEDKVAELEAKNEVAQHENENLRDLLSRLQSENVMLKQATFTFTMAKPQADPSSAPKHFSPENSIFNASPPSSVITPESSRISPKPTNLVDWTSLTSFDPNMLSLLDENPQPTATSSAMNLDIFDSNSDLPSSLPFTTIASNPMLMSFASSFDSMAPPTDTTSGIANGNGNRSNAQSFNFDLNSMNTWPTPPPPTQDATSLDDLFAGYLNPNQNADFSFAATPSMSPITHQTVINNANYANIANNGLNPFLHKPATGISRTSSMSSPSSQSTASSDLLNTPKENQSISLASSPESDHHSDATSHRKSECPKTKSELAQRIAEAGASPFAPPGLKKSSDQTMGGPMISCAGSKFPRTAKSDKNVEVLSAWKTITSNPVFKDAGVDINDLCAEFTSKAKCDGTKVVLEPEGMANIIEALSAKKQ